MKACEFRAALIEQGLSVYGGQTAELDDNSAYYRITDPCCLTRDWTGLASEPCTPARAADPGVARDSCCTTGRRSSSLTVASSADDGGRVRVSAEEHPSSAPCGPQQRYRSSRGRGPARCNRVGGVGPMVARGGGGGGGGGNEQAVGVATRPATSGCNDGETETAGCEPFRMNDNVGKRMSKAQERLIYFDGDFLQTVKALGT